jgi:hypothetical protein
MTEKEKKKTLASRKLNVKDWALATVVLWGICLILGYLTPQLFDLRVRFNAYEVCSNIPEDTPEHTPYRLREFTTTIVVEPISVQNAADLQLLEQDIERDWETSTSSRARRSNTYIYQHPQSENLILVERIGSYTTNIYFCGADGRVIDGFRVGEVPNIDYSPDYKYITIYNNELEIYDGESLERITIIDVPYDVQLAFHPEEPLLAIFNIESQQIILWNIETDDEVARMEFPVSRLNWFMFNTDGTLLYAGNFYEHTSRLWGIPSEP